RGSRQVDAATATADTHSQQQQPQRSSTEVEGDTARLEIDGAITPIRVGLESGARVRGRLRFDCCRTSRPRAANERNEGDAKMKPESRSPRQLALPLAVMLTALLPVATAAAGTAKPFATVGQTQTLILNSEFATNNGITDVTCVGLRNPMPKLNSA